MQYRIDELNTITKELAQQIQKLKAHTPEAFYCPISGEVMLDPVVASDGHTYERKEIEKWIFQMNKQTSPMTNQPLKNKDLLPSHTLKSMIREWIDKNQRE